tara:strand:+ start:251 stop:913 length:663 start_codon:yes stop_codon:yes gene_type:complete
MRFLFVLVFIFCLSTLKVFGWGKLGGGVRFSPNLSFVSFKGDELTVKVNEDLFRSFAMSVLINGDFFVERKFKKVAFGTGIGFRRLSEQTETIITSLIEEKSLTYVHDYGTVPMYMRLKLRKRLFLRLGMTSLVNISNTLTTVLTDLSDGSTSTIISADDIDYNWFNFSGDIGIGYTFLKKKICMDIEPLFTKNLIGLLSGDVDANAFQSTFGVSMTIRY